QYIYTFCVVELGGRKLLANLIKLPVLDFDVILGMDWLAVNHATINCYRKCIEFKPEGETGFLFQGDRSEIPTNLISTIRAKKLLAKGCMGYLAHVMDTRVISDELQNLPIVRDYLDIFSGELSGLPPEREVEFGIELYLGTNPITIAPYRMAPTELKELKVQLQDLLEKEFIRLSSSPWGALVLFVKKKNRSLRLCIDYR